MKLNKLLTLSCVILSSFGLVSCESTRNQNVNLNIWTYYNGEIEQSFQEMVKEFNETVGTEKKIIVTAESQGAVNDLSSNLLATGRGDFGSGDMPDLFISYADTAFELDRLGKICSLDKYFSVNELSNFKKEFVDEGRWGDKNELKILPVSKSTEALYINKTDFDKFINANPDLNISYKNLETFEGLIDVSKKYFERTNKAFFGRDSIDNYFIIGARQLGIDILHYDEKGEFGINFDYEVFKKLWDSYYKPFIQGYFAANGKFRSNDVKSGHILAYIGSTSSGGYFPSNVVTGDSEAYNIECQVLPIPYFANNEKIAVSQGAGFCVTKSSPKKEKASITFLKWLCQKENIRDLAKTSGYFPATLDGFDDEFINSQENDLYKANFQVCSDTLKTYRMYTNVIGVNGSNYRNYIKTMFNDALTDSKEQLDNSENKEEIKNLLLSDSSFDSWFTTLKGNVNSYR